MMQPKLGPNYFTERSGVLAFAGVINQLGFAWRETANADVGIDGQVEHVDDERNCTGHVVAVQVKTGASYVESGDAQNIVFYLDEKHIHYWRTFPVPVILAVIDPDLRTIYWIDVRRYLRSPFTADEKAVRIPRDQKLSATSKQRLFESWGPVDGKLFALDEVLYEMAISRSDDAGFQMSYFELFALGLIDVGTKLFFSMSLCMEIAEYRAESHGIGEGMGSVEHEFVDRYIDFLVGQNLIYYDYSDYLIDRDERQLHPTFICQLTRRGREVVGLMHKHEEQHVIHESFVSLTCPFQERLPVRLAEMEQMQKRISDGRSST